MDAWRISRFPDLSGIGGTLYPGRWHTAGRPVVYLADSIGGAMLETLVHLQVQHDEVPSGYQALLVHVPDDVSIARITPPDDWKSSLQTTQALGDSWLRETSAALARVPSALMPQLHNFLLNPLHPDAARITVTQSEPVRFDPRLLRRIR